MLLSGKKIFLRSLQTSDAGLLYKWENDKSIWSVSGTKKPFTKKEIKDFIANQKDIYLDKQLRLMICIPSPTGRRTKDEGIGCIDLFDYNESDCSAGIGILIADKKNRQNGYASEALELLIKHSFGKLHLLKLYCHVAENNIPSLKLFKKHKFKIKRKRSDATNSRKKTAGEYFFQLLNT